MSPFLDKKMESQPVRALCSNGKKKGGFTSVFGTPKSGSFA